MKRVWATIINVIQTPYNPDIYQQRKTVENLLQNHIVMSFYYICTIMDSLISNKLHYAK